MRPIRILQLKNFKYKHINVVEDDNKFVVRVLTPLPKLDPVYQDTVSSSDILTTKPLLWEVLTINETQKYRVTLEGIFDKTTLLHKGWWKPLANINFVVNPVSIAEGRIDVISKRDCSFDNGEHSPDWSRRHGYTGIAQIYVRSTSDSLKDTAKSIATNINGILYTNLDTSRFVAKTEEDMRDIETRSAFLVPKFNLKCPAEVKSNELFECEVEIFRPDGSIATECDGDDWIIEASAGYIPKRKIKINKGKFKFTACALMLNPGDSMEISLKDLTNHVCTNNVVRVL